MDFLLNELSFHGQFTNSTSFKVALSKLMKIREEINVAGRNIFCQKDIFNAEVYPSVLMPHAVQELDINQRRSFISWIQRSGPHWDENKIHSPDHYLSHNEDIVTNTAIGEAAYLKFQGIQRGLISLVPSDWNFTPVKVYWSDDTDVAKNVEVENFWEIETVKEYLVNLSIPIDSWNTLESISKKRFENLTFSVDTFLPLRGVPFSPSASERIFSILTILNNFKKCFDETGARTQEGHEIYQNHFTGKKGGGGHGSTFSDSSEREKADFKEELTFKHPQDANKTIFCPWHGKVQTPQLRVHFSMPIRADEPLFIVYVGNKITKC